MYVLLVLFSGRRALTLVTFYMLDLCIRHCYCHVLSDTQTVDICKQTLSSGANHYFKVGMWLMIFKY